MPDENSKAQFVKENFEKIAKKYDRFNDWNSFGLHRLWKNHLVNILEKENPKVVMDLCSGSGDIAVRIAKITTIEKIYAVDFSPSLLGIALKRFQLNSFGEHGNRISAIIGDAMDLSYWNENSIDAVTIGFGLRNVKNLMVCLEEIYRVLKPGGVFLNLDVGKVKNKFIKFFADFYFFKIVPILGYILWGGKNEMFDYLPISSLSYPNQEELKKILQDKGFIDVYYKNFVFGNAVIHYGKKPIN